MNIWHDMSDERIQPGNFFALIEIEKGGKVKYELDKETGMLMLERILYTSTHFYAKYLQNDFPAKKYHIWIADYSNIPQIDWQFWQHTDWA